jgi:serine phosphatase RsbU (regulator of sigma subunit)
MATAAATASVLTTDSSSASNSFADTLLGVTVGFRGKFYGDLYLSDRYDGQPFDATDESTVVTLATAAGIAIENAHLFLQARESAEHFQRMLLPTLPDLHPFEAAAIYRPAAEPSTLGGDWYDAVPLPDDAVGVIVGDVVGHDLRAAAAMAAARNMLRALLFDRRTPPSAVLTQLDHTVVAITDIPVTTVCLARIEPQESGWGLRRSSAGHFPPLLITRDHRAEYLHAEPGLPLGVDPEQPRSDHVCSLPSGGIVVFFTDGLVERPTQTVDQGLDALADLALTHADQSLDAFVQSLADNLPSDGHDDMTILALRIPACV